VRRSARWVLALQALAVAVVAACTAGHVKPGASPAFTVASTSTSITAAYATVQLASVPGHHAVTVPMGPGKSSLAGTVSGPTGPIAGATVHVERVVDGYIGSTDLSTQADGTWTLPNLLGGQYRVRAWRAPDLDQVGPAVLFLAQVPPNNAQTVNLQLDQYGGLQVTPGIAPAPPIIGEPAQLVVELTVSSVGTDGVVRAAPRAGVSVQLSGQGNWVVQGSLSQTTHSDGKARWQLTCEQLGSQQLSVVVGGTDVYPLDLPPCSPVPTTTTSTSTTIRSQPTTTLKHSK
jgi:hypothetical protein